MDVQIACACPVLPDGQARHPFDTVTLHEPIEPRVRRALLYEIGLDAEATTGDKLAMLSEGYVLRCIDRWTIIGPIEGENGKTKLGPLPPSRANIQRLILDDAGRGDVLTKATDELYSEAVLLPLILGASNSSPASPTGGSTSRATNGRTPPKRPSRPSSTTTTRTVDTAPMPWSNGGASSSSGN